MIRGWHRLIAWTAIGTAVLSLAAEAGARKPKLPPGLDPGGVAIAVVTTGIDYSDPVLAGRLARDGEGDLIGWDLIDRDNRPYLAANEARLGWNEGGERLLRALADNRALRLVPIRINQPDAASLMQAVAFAVATPAKIVVIPIALDRAQTAAVMSEVALRHTEHTFIVIAGSPAITGATPANVITVADVSTVRADVVVERGGGSTGTDAPSTRPAVVLADFIEQFAHCAVAITGVAPAGNPKLARIRAMSAQLERPTGGQVSAAPCGLRF